MKKVIIDFHTDEVPTATGHKKTILVDVTVTCPFCRQTGHVYWDGKEEIMDPKCPHFVKIDGFAYFEERCAT